MKLDAEIWMKTLVFLVVFVSRSSQDYHGPPGCPHIITRANWGARPYNGTPTNLTLPLSQVFIHHTVTPKPCLTFQECSAVVKSIQQYHQDKKGWDDIGYNFLVGSDGNVYEGRGWFWQGAHTKGYNDVSYGVAFIGNYTLQLPNEKAVKAVKQLLTCATAAGRLMGNITVRGHRDVVNTKCPGDALYAKIKQLSSYAVGEEDDGDMYKEGAGDMSHTDGPGAGYMYHTDGPGAGYMYHTDGPGAGDMYGYGGHDVFNSAVPVERNLSSLLLLSFGTIFLFLCV